MEYKRIIEWVTDEDTSMVEVNNATKEGWKLKTTILCNGSFHHIMEREGKRLL